VYPLLLSPLLCPGPYRQCVEAKIINVHNTGLKVKPDLYPKGVVVSNQQPLVTPPPPAVHPLPPAKSLALITIHSGRRLARGGGGSFYIFHLFCLFSF